MLHILASFKALPGKEDELRAATLAVIEPSRAEAGCVLYDVTEDAEALGTYFIRETGKSEAALKEHFETPHLKKLVEQHKSLLDGALKLHKLNVLG